MRVPTIDRLIKLGWSEGQLQWQPEWRVPQSPHDAAAREGSKSFSGWPVDLAVFDDAEHAGDWQHVVGIFEFKAPTIDTGISQLEIYLTREPRARFGYWTNGTDSVAVYKLADGGFTHMFSRSLPTPKDDLALPSKKPLTFNDLVPPDGARLRSVFKRLLDVVVARDSQSTRAEGQLNQLCNLLLLKLESDTLGSFSPVETVSFQLMPGGPSTTAKHIHAEFKEMIVKRQEIFREQHESDLILDNLTIQEVVYELSPLNLLEVGPEAVSSAFQIFRRANLKAGEGQYFTPHRVIKSCVALMELRPDDKIVDPACGTGGFLIEAFRSVTAKGTGKNAVASARTWAHRQAFGVDKDAINVKLARAIMVILGDGSAHIHVGDSLREDRWPRDYPHLQEPLKDGTFTVVITNPPFGQNLKFGSLESRRNHYSIASAAASGRGGSYRDLEIGLIFVERCYRLLMDGGRLGIILPETYFFSSTYAWFAKWLKERFILRGVLNIPMEAFQGFCRAKTNFYVLEKRVTNDGT